MFEAMPLVAFWALVLGEAARAGGLSRYRDKPMRDWLLDLVGLIVQGALIPALQIVVVAAAWHVLFPALRGALWFAGHDLWLGFLLSFVGVDYLYYWNHRLLHRPALWPIHMVHHTVSQMDVLGTSRNTLFTSFLIVYLWVHGTMAYLLRDPTGYFVGVSLGAALDLWRHSDLDPPRWLARPLGAFLVLPRDHAWHHASDASEGNYGANLSLWDRLHGTWMHNEQRPRALGVPCAMSLPRALLWPVTR